MDIRKLYAPFPAGSISWRVGSTNKDKTKGMALAYIDARDVMTRLDDVCGPENWQDRYEFHGTRTLCYLSIRIGGEWVTKADGAGDSDVEAEKGSISDALKRAAVKWGIGRYLYDMEAPWVAIEPFGRSYKIAASEHARLDRISGKAKSPAPAAPLETPPTNTNPKGLTIAKPCNGTVADTLIAALRMAVSHDELLSWAESNKATIDGLPEGYADDVRKAYQAHRKSLPVPQKEAAE